MCNANCESVFVPQLGPDDVTNGSVENYDLDWPPAVSEDPPLDLQTAGPVK